MKNLWTSLKAVDPVYFAILALFVVSAGTFSYGYINLYGKIATLKEQNTEQSNELEYLKGTLESTTSLLSEDIKETKDGLSTAIQIEKENVTAIKEKLGGFESQVGTISGTVNTLEKLSKTDPELLQKYSKVFFLNEHYVPPRLSDIKNSNKYFESRDLEIHSSVKPHLEEMLADALKVGVKIYVMSSYRSFDAQQDLKGQYSVIYGEGTANQFSADQGYSEHQLGTTVDLITTGIDGKLSGFGDTEAYNWLLNNAYKYGFVLSYPESNGYYIFEPWHWRFVGVALSTHLKETGKNFYDLEQREIDEYLVNIFD